LVGKKLPPASTGMSLVTLPMERIYANKEVTFFTLSFERILRNILL